MHTSIISNVKVCYLCKTPLDLHKHHIYYGSKRKISDEHGFWIYLCSRHHISDEGVHFNIELDYSIRRLCQRVYEKKHTHEEFMALINKNYL